MHQDQLTDLLKKQTTGQLMPAELDALTAYISQATNKTQVTEAILILMASDTTTAVFNEARLLPLLGEIFKSDHSAVAVKATDRASFSLLKFRWIKYAAILLCIACMGVLAYIINKPGSQEETRPSGLSAQRPDVGPGINKAVLTMSDGRRVELSDGQETLNDGGVNINKKDGALIYGKTSITAYNTITTPRGGQYNITLPDGSRIWLNAASSLSYPTTFKEQRKVSVTGEAFFEIAKDPSMPFIVTSANQEITVYGTHFNVNAYEDEGVVKTSLLEGSVKVSRQGHHASMRPGQQSLVATNGSGIRVQDADVQQAASWKNGYFSFSNADIKMIMRQLSRWYDVEVVYEGRVPQVTFSGEIGRSLTLDQLLGILKETRIQYRIEGKKLVIMSNG